MTVAEPYCDLETLSVQGLVALVFSNLCCLTPSSTIARNQFMVNIKCRTNSFNFRGVGWSLVTKGEFFIFFLLLLTRVLIIILPDTGYPAGYPAWPNTGYPAK